MKDLKSHYNPRTGEIVANSRIIYLHEYRHSKQPSILFVIYSYWLLSIAVIFMIVSIWSGIWWMMLIGIPPILLILVLEIDAWIYALRKIRRMR